MCAKLRTVAASNNRDHAPQSLYYCLFAPHICIIALLAHPLHVESHIQRNAIGEVATISLPFYTNHTDRTFFCEGFTHCDLHNISWSQHHFVAVGNPEGHVRKASHWQQATIEIMRRNQSIIGCACHICILLLFAHIPFMVNHTFNPTPPESLQQYACGS